MQGDWKPFGALNKVLTSQTVTERVLGVSGTATVRTNVLFLGTGNNIEPVQDMRRRVVSIRLTPSDETPALRKFEHDPVGTIKQHRARVVSCALTIIDAFRAAGQPQTPAPSIGSYGEWSIWCRQPLLWLGEPDPAQSLIDQVSNDSDQAVLGQFLRRWLWAFQSRSVTVRQLIAKADQEPQLEEALADLPVFEGRHVNPNKLGWFFKKNLGRRADGLRIEAGDSSERTSWRVVKD